MWLGRWLMRRCTQRALRLQQPALQLQQPQHLTDPPVLMSVRVVCGGRQLVQQAVACGSEAQAAPGQRRWQ